MPSLSDVFGPAVLVAAVVLAIWEARAYRCRVEDDWLITPRRILRRMVMSALLAVIGLIILLEGYGVIATAGRPGVLLAYVSGLGGLSIVLVLLAIVDLHDTSVLAARKSMQDLERAFGAQDVRKAGGAQRDKNPDDDTT